MSETREARPLIAKFRARAFQDALAIGNTVAPRLGADGVAQVQEVIVRAMVAAYVAAAPTPEPERPAERCVDMGALDALLSYGREERDAAVRDKHREGYVRWSGWVDALERLKAQSGKPLSVEEDTHAGE